MYTYYAAVAGWVHSDVVQDIGALLTGSNIAALSSSCNKTDSHQNGTTIAAGWTMHDADNGETVAGFVIKCQDVDNLTTKYLNFRGTGTTGFAISSLEDWDATLHTSTNESTESTSMSFGTVGTAFNLHIFCTPEYIYISNAGQANNAIGHFEVRRDTAFLADATVKPLVNVSFYVQKFHSVTPEFYLPRLKNPKTGATLLTTSAAFLPLTLSFRYHNAASGIVQVGQTTPTLDSSGNSFHHVYPIFLGWLDGSYPYTVYHGRVAANSAGHAPMFTRCDISGAAIGDTMVVDSTNYMYVSTSYGLLFPIM